MECNCESGSSKSTECASDLDERLSRVAVGSEEDAIFLSKTDQACRIAPSVGSGVGGNPVSCD